GARHERLGRHDGKDRRRSEEAPPVDGDAFPDELRGSNGHYRKGRQGSEDAQVQDPPPQPLQVVRTATRLHAQVRHVPSVLPQAGPRRRRDGCDQEFLVEKTPNYQFPTPKETGSAWELEVGNWELSEAI